MKIRKVKRGKKFRYNVNRKRLQKVRSSTGSIQCREIKENWADKKSIRTNLRDMGLALDPNQAIGIPNTKQERIEIVKLVNNIADKQPKKKTKRPARKGFVAELLEEDANAPREKLFRLPKGVVTELTYFLDKYQFNYVGMVRDRKNFNQYTWRQFRAKIKKFMSIPEQFNEYLLSKNLTMDDVKNWKECRDDE